MARISLLVVGKTTKRYVEEATGEYLGRLKHYNVTFELQVVPDLKDAKNVPVAVQKQREGEGIMKRLQPSDNVILLDEKGRTFSSLAFADFVGKEIEKSRRIVFVIGGPFGFSDEVYARADGKLSLSPMTFSHQLIRAIFAEQLYRAFTILKGERYHHE